jgi:hypothetical protein
MLRRSPGMLLLGLMVFYWQSVLHSKENGIGEPLNLAVFIDGQVSVKEKGWNNFAPVVFGSILHPGDLLRVDPASQAKVVCSDLTLHTIQPGTTGIPCAGEREILQMSNGSLINPTRSWTNDGLSPVVLSPRKTKLLSSHPILSWTPIRGASNFRVIVRGPRLYWITQVAAKNEILYPDSAPRLESGVSYKLIVETGDRSSSSEPGPDLGFSILDSKAAQEVQSAQKQIEGLGLPEGPTQFLIAHLYAANGLNAEAIQRLEVLSPRFKAAAVERLLADLYLRIGLPRQAEASYLKSLDLAREEKDEVGQMMVHLALARIYEQTLGNQKAAGEHLDVTLAIANKIGDDLTTNQANALLAEIQQAGK